MELLTAAISSRPHDISRNIVNPPVCRYRIMNLSIGVRTSSFRDLPGNSIGPGVGCKSRQIPGAAYGTKWVTSIIPQSASPPQNQLITTTSANLVWRHCSYPTDHGISFPWAPHCCPHVSRRDLVAPQQSPCRQISRPVTFEYSHCRD